MVGTCRSICSGPRERVARGHLITIGVIGFEIYQIEIAAVCIWLQIKHTASDIAAVVCTTRVTRVLGSVIYIEPCLVRVISIRSQVHRICGISVKSVILCVARPIVVINPCSQRKAAAESRAGCIFFYRDNHCRFLHVIEVDGFFPYGIDRLGSACRRGHLNRTAHRIVHLTRCRIDHIAPAEKPIAVLARGRHTYMLIHIIINRFDSRAAVGLLKINPRLLLPHGIQRDILIGNGDRGARLISRIRGRRAIGCTPSQQLVAGFADRRCGNLRSFSARNSVYQIAIAVKSNRSFLRPLRV